MALSGEGTGTASYNFKVVLLGEGCVGKTSVVLRYVEDKFNSEHVTTLQLIGCRFPTGHIFENHISEFLEIYLSRAMHNTTNHDKYYEKIASKASFVKKKINVSGKAVNLAIWDTAGQEKFHALGPIYYRMSNGAILVYDITDEDSFNKVKNWVKELKKMLGGDICLTIAGNKIDLEKDRNVPVDVADEYASSVGAKHFQTSAKLNKNIDELFLELTQRMISRYDQLESQKSNKGGKTGSMKRNVVVVEDDQVEGSQRKQGCCASS